MTEPLPHESYTAIEAALLRILRAREGAPVQPLRHDPDALGERPVTTSDDDGLKASA